MLLNYRCTTFTETSRDSVDTDSTAESGLFQDLGDTEWLVWTGLAAALSLV